MAQWRLCMRAIKEVMMMSLSRERCFPVLYFYCFMMSTVACAEVSSRNAKRNTKISALGPNVQMPTHLHLHLKIIFFFGQKSSTAIPTCNWGLRPWASHMFMYVHVQWAMLTSYEASNSLMFILWMCRKTLLSIYALKMGFIQAFYIFRCQFT